MTDPHNLAKHLAQIMQTAFTNLDPVAIPSFGTFTPVKRDEEIVTDLSTGRHMMLPPQVTLEFTPAAMLRKHLCGHE